MLDKEILDRSMKVLEIYHNSPGAQAWFQDHGKLMLSETFYTHVAEQLGKVST